MPGRVLHDVAVAPLRSAAGACGVVGPGQTLDATGEVEPGGLGGGARLCRVGGRRRADDLDQQVADEAADPAAGAAQIAQHAARHPVRAIIGVDERTTLVAAMAADAVGPRIHAEGVKRGLFSRTRGDVYQLAPPIVSSEQTIDRCVEILAEATKAVLG